MSAQSNDSAGRSVSDRSIDVQSGPSVARRGRGIGDQRAVSFAHWVIRWRWAVIALTLVAALAAASGGRFLGFSSDYRVFFGDDNPQLQAFEVLQNVYTKDDNISFVVKSRAGNAFTPEVLSAVRELTEAAWQIPYATRVDSVTNFQHSFAEGDDLTVRDLVPASATLTADEIAAIREVALAEPLMVDRNVARDGATVSVNVTITRPELSEDEGPAAMAYAHDLAAEFRANNPDLQLGITGLLPLNNAFVEASMRDMGTLVPLMYGVLLLVMVALLRSASGTFVALMVIGLTAATAMGVAGWMGIRLSPPSALAPTVILTIAIADSIHLLVTLFGEMRRGASKHDAIVESLRVNFGPVFLTSLTTIIGFLSLNFSDSPPFGDLGNITSVGVGAAWVYSIFLLPALMAVLPVRVKIQRESTHRVMDRLADFVIARRKPLLFGMTALVIGLGAMIPRIELNDQFVNYFDPSLAFRSDTDFAMENLSGIYQVNWSLPAGETGGISDPDYLRRVDAFSDWLRQRHGVAHVQSLTDVFRRLNKNMHGDDPAWYRLPDDRDLAAQYLLLFEMSLPYGLDLNNQINVDKSALRLIVTTDNISTVELRALEADAGTWLDENFPSAASSEATSAFVMFAYISERNINGMLIGSLLAFLLISASLGLALRNFKLGMVSLVPNLIPVVMAFGVWALFVGEVGLASSVVAATSLGIIVDATVHFLSKYQRALRERGKSTEDAIRYAFSTVGTALWVTSAILVAGFAVLSLSTFKMNEDLGLLTAIAIAAALLADFLLLPPLLISLDRRRERSRRDPVFDSNLITQAVE